MAAHAHDRHTNDHRPDGHAANGPRTDDSRTGGHAANGRRTSDSCANGRRTSGSHPYDQQDPHEDQHQEREQYA
ncbi:hypothetical protein [Streptomyces sp. NPDC055109]